MNVLAIDTATDTLALAVRTAGHRACLRLQAGLKHSQMLLPQVTSMLEAAGLTPARLELLVCSVGPGSFTGIRIGLATAKGLAMATGTPLVGVSTLDALAWRWGTFDGTVAVVNPSLRRRLYGALYRGGRRVSEYLELLPEEMARMLAGQPDGGAAAGSAACPPPLLLTGAAAPAMAERLSALAGPGRRGGVATADASGVAADPEGLLECGLQALAELQGGVIPDPLPLYLRRSEAELLRARKDDAP